MSLWKGEGGREGGREGEWGCRGFLAHVKLAVVQLLPVQHLDGTSSDFGGAVADEPVERGGMEGGRVSGGVVVFSRT